MTKPNNAACYVAKCTHLTDLFYCVMYAPYVQPFINHVCPGLGFPKTNIRFVEPGVKVNGRYYREVLLMQKLLQGIHQLSAGVQLIATSSGLASISLFHHRLHRYSLD